MYRYISLIRGINVGGKTLRMDKLKTIYESLGFSDIETYIQSGNVLFSTQDTDTVRLQSVIEGAIKAESGLDVSVLVLTPAELIGILGNNPFIRAGITDTKKMHVTLLSGEPGEVNKNKIDPAGYGPDKFIISGKSVYLYCPEGYGRTKLTNNFWESKLKLRATTRNWNTMNKLYEMLML